MLITDGHEDGWIKYFLYAKPVGLDVPQEKIKNQLENLQNALSLPL